MFPSHTLDVLTLPPNTIALELQELWQDNNTDNNDDYEVTLVKNLVMLMIMIVTNQECLRFSAHSTRWI